MNESILLEGLESVCENLILGNKEEAYKKAMEAIKKWEAAKETGDQIVYVPTKVEDELPDRDSKVLAKSGYGDYKITNGYHINSNRCDYWLKPVKLSLPQSVPPYKEEERLDKPHHIGAKLFPTNYNPPYKEEEKK